MTAAAPTQPQRGNARLFVPLLIGAAVSVTLGAYERFHSPTGVAVHVPGFTNILSFKAWLATLATVCALVQITSALVMYGKIKMATVPSWISPLHRWSGRLAFFATIPVAVSCLYALGFQHYSTRVLIHSILGTLFFGVFTIKMLVLTKRGVAGWVLPLLGGLVFTMLVGLWLTSSLWYFTTVGVKF